MAVYRVCTPPVHDGVQGPYTAEYAVVHTGVDTVCVHSRVHGSYAAVQMAVYTCTVRVQGRVTAVYTARTRPCTQLKTQPWTR